MSSLPTVSPTPSTESGPKYGILLPITSRSTESLQKRGEEDEKHCIAEARARVTDFIRNLSQGVQHEKAAEKVKIYVGVDEELDYFGKAEGIAFIRHLLETEGFCYDITLFDVSFIGQLCRMWNELAAKAYRDGQDFTVLLGDDVTIDRANWLSQVAKEYRQLAQEVFLTTEVQEKFYGFGCISLKDKACPNFPSFPVMHRIHFEVFGDEMFPSKFVNQDADPFLFSTYASLDASRFSEVEVYNSIGGHTDARYQKHHINWKGQLLDEAISKVKAYLARNDGLSSMSRRNTSMDVIVPTYRCNLSILERICALELANQATNFIIIVDNPRKTKGLQEALEHLPHVRVRGNEENKGCSAARNHGLKESAAEWVLFLDDDVIPQKDLILQYAEAIAKLGDSAHGFIGLTQIPEPTKLHTQAVVLSDVTYMYSIASVLPNPKWGVTANLVMRRTPGISFREDVFPKTGGGEDVDICLRCRMDGKNGQAKTRRQFYAVPQAIVTHPWWNDEKRGYKHFFRWATGDGYLQTLYPLLTYWCWPNVVECMVLAILLALIWGFFTGCWFRSFLPVLTIVESEILYNIIKHTYWESWRLPGVQGLQRVLAAAESAVIILSLESGRLWGHFQRWIGQGGLASGFCRRFDWFGGEIPNARDYERRQSLLRCIGHIVWAMIVQLTFWLKGGMWEWMLLVPHTAVFAGLVIAFLHTLD